MRRLSRAHEQLIVDNMALVHFVAHRMARRLSDQVDHDEMVSAGALGLIAAARSFDPTRGSRFATYAVPHIRGAIFDELRRLDPATRGTRRHARMMAAAREILESRLGQPPSSQDVAEMLSISRDTLDQWERDVLATREFSLQSPLPETGGEHCTQLRLHEFEEIAQEPEHGPNVLDRIHNETILARAMAQLSDRERDVLTRYYWRDQKMGVIARHLGVTKNRVSQIIARAIARLRLTLAADVA